VGRRGIFNIVLGIICCGGFAILVASRSAILSYCGVFTVAGTLFPVQANNLAWINNNNYGVYTRGVAIALITAWGNLNGIMSSNVYRDNDQPWYRTANSIMLGIVCVGMVGGSILHHTLLKIANRKRIDINQTFGGEEEYVHRNQLYTV
jgi:hypothetical protein